MTFLHSGPGRALLDFAKQARQKGHVVTIAATAHFDNFRSESLLIEEAHAAGIEIILCDDLYTRDFNAISHSAKTLEKGLAKVRYDLIHSQAAIPGFAAALACKNVYGNLLPHISTVHGWAPNKLPWMKLQDVFFLNNVDRVLAVSNDVRQYLIDEGVKAKKIKTVYNGCDFMRLDKLSKLDKLAQEEVIPKSKKWRIGTLAYLSKRKCLNHLIEAIAHLPLPIRQELEVVIIGEGEERPFLEKMIGELNLQDTVCLIGGQKNPFPWLNSFDLFVLPSLSEGLSVALVEAAYFIRPIVTTKVQGNREIGKKIFAALVPPNDPKALAKAIARQLLKGPDPDKLLQAKAWVENRFSQDMHFKQMEALYSQLLTTFSGSVG